MSTTPITMPALSDTMETGRLLSWRKKPGDVVKKGEVLAEIESDKAVMEMEAFQDGYLQGPLAEPGSELPVGAVIGYLGTTAGEASPGAGEQEQEQAPPARKPSPPPPPGTAVDFQAEPALPPRPVTRGRASADRLRASPRARALARELGLDLRLVSPGPDGILRSPQVVAAALQGPLPDLDAGPPWTLTPLTPMERAVAQEMIAAARTPAFHVRARLPMAPLRNLAREHKWSLTLLLARACGLAVQAHPRFNALYTPAGMVRRERIDMGIAVAQEEGLVTPVLRDVAHGSLDELSQVWDELKENVRQRRLKPRDYSGATFYLSNLGTFPVVRQFDAVLPVGAAAILAIGAERKGMAEFTLTCDHRVIYGADAAHFLATLSGLLQSPDGIPGPSS